MVAYECLGSRHKIHVTVYSSQMPHVLSFKIGTVAPAVDTYGELVLTVLGDKTGDVELRVGVSTLAVAYIPSVNPYRRGTVHTVEVEEDALVSPALGQGEGTAVEACGIVVLNAIVRPPFAGEGRIVVERIAHVGIHRCAEACHLPRKGHSDGVPIGVVQACGIELT